jgi:UDP-N-acetylmuramate dehydrogenase
MSLNVRENVRLGAYTTLGIGGPARWFADAATEDDVAAAVQFAAKKNAPLFVLGGGSNLLVPDAGFKGFVLMMTIDGTEQQVGVEQHVGVEEQSGRFDVGAGVNWDAFVQQTVEAGCAGVECLAGIPGSVGGTPVQNVGAYGQDVAETIESVRAFDRVRNAFVEMSAVECRFRYRQSIFNTQEPGRYIVTRVRFALRPGGAPTLKYADVQKAFHDRTPTLVEVAEAVREIRRRKGMLIVEGDPDSRSVGSFFRNPVVAAEEIAHIAAAAGQMEDEVPMYPAGAEGQVKLAAAWLLERSGFVKGYGEGRVGISSKHTLALVNRGQATLRDVERLEREIVDTVEEKFGVRLEREPVVLQ